MNLLQRFNRLQITCQSQVIAHETQRTVRPLWLHSQSNSNRERSWAENQTVPPIQTRKHQEAQTLHFWALLEEATSKASIVQGSQIISLSKMVQKKLRLATWKMFLESHRTSWKVVCRFLISNYPPYASPAKKLRPKSSICKWGREMGILWKTRWEFNRVWITFSVKNKRRYKLIKIKPLKKRAKFRFVCRLKFNKN